MVGCGRSRALKEPEAPLRWQREGRGTAFRIGPSSDNNGLVRCFGVVAMKKSDLPWKRDEPVASRRNTVNLDPPAKGFSQSKAPTTTSLRR